MSDVTRILSDIESGDPSAAGKLLPLVYDELRKLAAIRLAKENLGQTLQPTALVHEAYLRLVDGEQARHWDSRGHFFAAVAEATEEAILNALCAADTMTGFKGRTAYALPLERVREITANR